MSKELADAIERESRGLCDIVTEASISLDGAASQPIDLSRKASRLIVENAAIADAIAQREVYPVHGPVLVSRPGVGEAEWS